MMISSTHYHQNPELFYVLKGTLEVQIDDASFVLKHGDMIVINANKRHKMIGSEELLGARFEIDFHLLAEELGTLQLLFWCNTVAGTGTRRTVISERRWTRYWNGILSGSRKARFI